MFKFSALADYGLVLLTHMDEGSFTSIHVLSETTHMPQATLAKLATQLERAKLLQSREGRGGGYKLARSRSHITLKDVVEALEGPIAPVKCVAHPGSCDFENNCTAKPHWPKLSRDLQRWAESYTLDDLSDRQSSKL